MDVREQKGLEIAARLPLQRHGDTWRVPSQSGGSIYTVQVVGGSFTCTCPDYETRQLACKHIYAVRFTQERERGPFQVPLSPQHEDCPTYPQQWKSYNTAQRNEQRELMRLLFNLCRTIPEPEYVFGRPRLSLSDMVFSSALKVYSTLSGRRFMGDPDTAYEKGYIAQVPHYSSIYRYMDNADLTAQLS